MSERKQERGERVSEREGKRVREREPVRVREREGAGEEAGASERGRESE